MKRLLHGRRRNIAGATALLIAGVAAGAWAERQRLFGYQSFNDCIIHEVKSAGGNARLLEDVLVDECQIQGMKSFWANYGPWEKYEPQEPGAVEVISEVDPVVRRAQEAAARGAAAEAQKEAQRAVTSAARDAAAAASDAMKQ